VSGEAASGHSPSSSPPAKKARHGYLHQFEDDDDDDVPVATDEVSVYLQTRVQAGDNSAAANILDWWCANAASFPRLSTIAKGILSIPAYSAASERSFSVAGCTISQRRTALASDTVENVLFVNSNAKTNNVLSGFWIMQTNVTPVISSILIDQNVTSVQVICYCMTAMLCSSLISVRNKFFSMTESTL